jgi:molybdopterin/thiamine biosynthesis adenylyltransferase/rhodanese-related sulfurtransferase
MKMFNSEELKRYSRHLLLSEIGEEGQRNLKAAKVLVVGAGGLGCPVLQYLAAAGVGTIGIVDYDVVEESNLQRQILYTSEDVGKPKAIVAKTKLAAQNPHIIIVSHPVQLSSENALEIFAAYDSVVDGSDNFATRYLVNDACVILGKVLVFASIFRFEGQVSVFNYKNGPTYRCLYPEPPADGEVPGCSETGVIGVLPGIAGTLQANEVIKIITGIGEPLNGKLLVFDALNMQFNIFNVKVNPSNLILKELKSVSVFCAAIKELSGEEIAEALKERSAVVIDVRSPEEHQQGNIGGKNIPLNELEHKLEQFSKDTSFVFYCASGTRSKKAVLLAEKKGYSSLAHLKNGIAGLTTGLS